MQRPTVFVSRLFCLACALVACSGTAASSEQGAVGDGSCQSELLPAAASQGKMAAALLQVGAGVSISKPAPSHEGMKATQAALEKSKKQHVKAIALEAAPTQGPREQQQKAAAKVNAAREQAAKSQSKSQPIKTKLARVVSKPASITKRQEKGLQKGRKGVKARPKGLPGGMPKGQTSPPSAEVPGRPLKPTWKPTEPSAEKLVAMSQTAVNTKPSSDGSALSFIRNFVASIGGIITHPLGFQDFIRAQRNDIVSQPVNALLAELRTQASKDDGWLKLAPPNKGPILWNMIRSDAWECDLIPMGDPRARTCAIAKDAEELSPELLHCGAEGSECSIEHANSYRTLSAIGSLPCCTTLPFCSAPACNMEHVPASSCAKRSPKANVAYMKREDTWPAYHGWGGSFELDTLKLIDTLGCRGGASCPEKTFDLAIDLGANTGYYTEKLTVRKFAKNYIMVEANPNTAGTLKGRWGDGDWKARWFSQQVKQPEGPLPDFEIINQALSSHSNGTLDMCLTERSMEQAGDCQVPIASIDSLIPDALTPAFVEHVQNAQSAYIKIDTEGMDELVLRGMTNLLAETRGEYEDKSPRFLVNFMQFEFSPALMQIAKEREGFAEYDIKTVTKYLESIGFETFMIGPRYLPLSHGSWHDEFKTWTADPTNNAGVRLNYPKFDDKVCPWCHTMTVPSFTSDVFAIRSTHPQASELKVALGACKQSSDFNLQDPQYSF